MKCKAVTVKQSILSLLAIMLIAGQFLSAIHGYVHLDKYDHEHSVISIYELDNLDEYRRHQHSHQHSHHQQNNEDEEICEICLALSGLNQLVNVAVDVSLSELLNTQTRPLPLNIIADTAYIIPPVRAPPYLVMS